MRMMISKWTTLAMMGLAACAGSADAHSEKSAGASTAGTPAAIQAPLPAGATRYNVASAGNAARFRVREQLMGHDLPNDAVGETQQITGFVTVDSKGALVPGQSKFVVQVTSLKSDSDRRDGYTQHRLLETDKYPTAVLVPTALRGLSSASTSAGTSGPVTFDIIGDLTAHGVTRPTTWHVTAKQVDGRVTGSASTRFTFADFAIDPPRVPVLLSVADTIGLEYDFTLTRDASATP